MIEEAAIPNVASARVLRRRGVKIDMAGVHECWQASKNGCRVIIGPFPWSAQVRFGRLWDATGASASAAVCVAVTDCKRGAQIEFSLQELPKTAGL